MNDQADNCGICRFRINVNRPGIDGGEGECHRLPPFLMMLNQNYKAIWPKVDSGMWCGEYQPSDVVDAKSSQALFQLPRQTRKRA